MFTIKQNDADPGKLSGLVQSWLSQPEDVCIVTQDQQRIMTHRLSLPSTGRLGGVGSVLTVLRTGG